MATINVLPADQSQKIENLCGDSFYINHFPLDSGNILCFFICFGSSNILLQPRIRTDDKGTVYALSYF